MGNIKERITGLSAEKRELLALLMRQQQLDLKETIILPRRRDSESAPLSFAQQRMWFIQKMEPSNPIYNCPEAFYIGGPLDVEALARSFDEVVRRHETLRTTFTVVDGEPVQVVSPASTFKLEVLDLSGDTSGREPMDAAQRLINEDARRPFDLERGPVLRAKLLRLGEEEHALLLTLHHIVSDGWSMGVLVGEVAALYDAFSHGRPSPLSELPLQYADFAVWQREWLAGENLERQLSFWKRLLAPPLPVLELPTDRPRPAVRSYRGAAEPLFLSVELTAALNELSRRHGATLFMTLLAGWQALLSRYSNQQDICVGTPIANRNRAETEGLIGFFANTLVMRTDLSGDPTFAELLKRVREVCLGAYAHQDMPFQRLVEELQPERDLSRPPLFQTMLVLQNAPQGEPELGGLRLRGLGGEGVTSKFDLTLTLTEGSKGLSGTLTYDADLFEGATIRRMLAHFRTLLSAAASDPARSLSSLPLLSPDERRLLVHDWNQTGREFDHTRLLHHLFEQQAARTPDDTALLFEHELLTYRQLNERANRLAHRLRSLGAGPDALVGVCLERSTELVVAILAALKSGSAYLPLDPSYPAGRLSFMLSDAAPRVLLTDSRLLARLPPHTARALCLDAEDEELAAQPTQNPAPLAGPEHLAYVIYTSGSTGGPKGVMVRHRSVVNLLGALDGAVYGGRREPRRVSLNAPVSFDSSVKQLVQLACGRAVCVLPERVRRDGGALLGYLRERGVGGLDCTPSQLRLLLAAGLGADAGGWEGVVLVGGEAIEAGVWRELEGLRGVEAYNVYGPTECTVDAVVRRVGGDAEGGEGGRPSIGRPVANTRAYILDAKGEPVPVGVAGELYLGGEGLARGYLNRAGLTAERFVPDAFSGEAGARLYRTGDLARYLEGGEIEYLGRVDNQVKVRGHRIELGEIESVLAELAGVRECVVVAREDEEGDKRLVAYVVGAGGGAEPSGAELREYLRGRVPEYMVPSTFVVLGELPLTPNGKVDHRALPAPGYAEQRHESGFVAPRDMLELRLKQVWESVLKVQPVGVRDNFFEVGGHSMLAVKLMGEVQKLSQEPLPLGHLFKYPTIEQMASMLRGTSKASPRGSLVGIQPGGSRKPFFCVHPVGGNVLCYYDLARHLGEEQPFYGLQAKGLEGEQEPFTDIELMAARYLEEVRAVQAEGPYLIGGWSMGGVIAFEMAQQLRAQGQEVGLLALIDSMYTSTEKAAAGDDGGAVLLDLFAANLAGTFNVNLPALTGERLAKLQTEDRLTFILDEAKKAGVIPPSFDLQQIRALLKVFVANFEALHSYVPKPYAGPLTIFAASESIQRQARNNVRGWEALARGPLSVHELPGNHFTIINKTHVQTLAAQIKTCLARIADAGRDGNALDELIPVA